MILVGNQRGNGRDLALHLLNGRDNEHVTIHELRGFVADELTGAFKETEAISQATKCKQYLFSLSLNPPPDADVPVAAFEKAIDEIETELGLSGQPRAIVFHEKHARRHAHVVWSRIDVDRMRGINLPHYKNRLQSIARDLYRTHDWDMPDGFKDPAKRDPNTFDRIEAAQAKSDNRNPKELKTLFRSLWAQSDSLAAFKAALLSEGFVLAQGNRRAFVAVDAKGKAYSISRWTGAGAKAVRDRLGLPDGLPTIEQAKGQLTASAAIETQLKTDDLLAKMVARHRAERADLQAEQIAAAQLNRKASLSLLPKGMRAIWARATGRYQKLQKQLEDQTSDEAIANERAMDTLISRQLSERRSHEALRAHQKALDNLARPAQRKTPDQRQYLVLADDAPLPTAMAVEFRPEAVLDYLSDKSASFTEVEIKNLLTKIDKDTSWQVQVLKRLLASPDLVSISDDEVRRFTTADYQRHEERLHSSALNLFSERSFTVSPSHLSWAIASKNIALKQLDAELSDEQISALEHATAPSGLSFVVGVAGAGKSTLLDVARTAWERQGMRVYGAALAGKAADGLEQASGIPSRTLATLEKSWEHGFDPIAPGSVVVIDEVGMVGTRQLARVLSKLNELRCKVVLVGDPEQLQPIQAGQPFKDLVARNAHAELTEVRRQKQSWQRQASLHFAEGHVDKALESYEMRGYVHAARTNGDAVTALVEAYLADSESGRSGSSRLALAHRRKDVFEINQRVRAVRSSAGDLGPEVLVETDHGPRAFAAGDRELFTRNDPVLGVRNGMLGTIVGINDRDLRIELDENERTFTMNVNKYRSLEHGYAVSIHKSQGCTVDRTFVLGGATMDQHLTYVAMTRHKEQARLFKGPSFAKMKPRFAQLGRPETMRRLTRRR